MNPEPSRANTRSSVIWGLMVSGNYFSLFEVKPALGRTFLPEEDQAVGKAPVAVISYELWKRNFSGDANAIGSSIKLNNHLYTIIGVAPRGFTGFDLSYRPEIFVPMSMIGDIVPGGEKLLQSRHSRSFVIRSRIRPGVKISEAQAEADDLAEEVGREAVIVTPVARLTNALGDSAFEEASRLSADAGLADSELLGQIIEGAGLALEEKSAEESAGDPGEAVAFGGESHALDEGLAIGHGGKGSICTFSIN